MILCSHTARLNRQVAESFRGLVRRIDGESLKFSDQRYIIFDAAAVRVQAVFRGHRAHKKFRRHMKYAGDASPVNTMTPETGVGDGSRHL